MACGFCPFRSGLAQTEMVGSAQKSGGWKKCMVVAGPSGFQFGDRLWPLLSLVRTSRGVEMSYRMRQRRTCSEPKANKLIVPRCGMHQIWDEVPTCGQNSEFEDDLQLGKGVDPPPPSSLQVICQSLRLCTHFLGLPWQLSSSI